MIVFLSRCPELERRKHTGLLFEMCCLCLPHTHVRVPDVGLGSPNNSDHPADLRTFIVPLQCYLLSLGQDCGFLMNPVSIAACGRLPDDSGDAALIPTYDPWTFVDYHRREYIYSSLAKEFKMCRTRSGQEEVVVSSVVTVPSGLAQQNPKPVQPPKMDIRKTSKTKKAEKTVTKLKKSGDSAGCPENDS